MDPLLPPWLGLIIGSLIVPVQLFFEIPLLGLSWSIIGVLLLAILYLNFGVFINPLMAIIIYYLLTAVLIGLNAVLCLNKFKWIQPRK